MDKYTILNRAYTETFRLWAYEKDLYEKNNNDPIAKHKMARYWDELSELGRELIEIERQRQGGTSSLQKGGQNGKY